MSTSCISDTLRHERASWLPHVVHRLTTDPGFCTQAQADIHSAVVSAGISLSDEEYSVIHEILQVHVHSFPCVTPTPVVNKTVVDSGGWDGGPSFTFAACSSNSHW